MRCALRAAHCSVRRGTVRCCDGWPFSTLPLHPPPPPPPPPPLPPQLWHPGALKDVKGIGKFKDMNIFPSGGIDPDNAFKVQRMLLLFCFCSA